MFHRLLFIGGVACLVGMGPAPAVGRAAPPALDPEALAGRAWDIADLILEKQVDPPTRQEMFLGGLRGLLRATDQDRPPGLSVRASAVTGPAQLADLLRDLWPKGEAVNKVKPEQLEKGFFDGMLAAVPGPPEWLPPAIARVTEQVAGNRYVGIGIQIRKGTDEPFPQLVDVFRRGTARKGGARQGDLVVEVNGKSTRDVPLTQVVDWLRGEEGSSLTIVVRQPKSDDARTLHLTREKVPFDTLHGFRRLVEERWDYRIAADQPVAYAHVASFNSATLHELRQLERTLRAEGVRALVLDLRGGGGMETGLDAAALVADALLDGGVMWRLRDVHAAREVRADPECLFRGWPMAVLVGDRLLGVGPSAVAAALQDNGRAVLVGGRLRLVTVQTLGQEYPGGRPVPAPAGAAGEEAPGAGDAGQVVPDFPVTGLIPLPDGGGALRLRTALLQRARKDRGWPVRPDQLVKTTAKQDEAVRTWLQQKGLSDLPPGVTDKAPEDPQLARAVELLRERLKKAAGPAKSGAKGGEG
jgi:hypothetical protein